MRNVRDGSTFTGSKSILARDGYDERRKYAARGEPDCYDQSEAPRFRKDVCR